MHSNKLTSYFPWFDIIINSFQNLRFGTNVINNLKEG